MTRQEWEKMAAAHERCMAEIDDPDDAIYKIHERKRNACLSNAADAPDDKEETE